MELDLFRTLHSDRTEGRFMSGTEHLCFTLEDPVRETKVGSRWIWNREYKIPGKTAIPSGRYRVTLTQSQRFLRLLPLLVDVPDFTGVRIHAGNTVSDTEGCLLAATSIVDGRGQASQAALARVIDRLDRWTKHDSVWINIRNEE